METDPDVEVVQVTHEHLAQLQELWRADWLEEHPQDDQGAREAVVGIQRALNHHDFLHSDSFWLLAAQANGRFIGYMTVIRIPKVDSRLLFLFIDELFVLRSFRRQGVARALLEAAMKLGHSLSAEGIRLIVDAENAVARRLYKTCGFAEGEQIFCQRRFRRF
jgi:ribosomal protein S18 acetylase RimI-like enzyme